MIRFCFALTLIGVASTSPLFSQEEFNSGQLGGLRFRSVGPALMSGRIADVAVDPVKPNTWYVAAGSGNLWKTTNSGTTWTPIFDNYGSYSIGCVTIDPGNRNTVWVGTGENVAGRHVGFGDGVYVSHDAGASFRNVGLRNSEHISKIVVHPRDADTVYVASQGPAWSKGGERGLFCTRDGGKTWKNILSKGPYTGVTDVVMDPSNPNILYAATYHKHRTVWALMAGGPESGIHKSTDGGKTWTELQKGLPGGDRGKIALAVSPQKPNVLYAGIELPGRTGGFYRSENHGVSWTRKSDYVGGGTGPHYYQEIWCDPHRFDSIYHANVRLGRSDDGGATFEYVGNSNKHVDNHAVAFHPTDPDFVIAGCDGGVYRSFDRCKTWMYVNNLPLTQFYKVAVDYDYPFYHIVGGTQDNNTQYGPAKTNRRQGITNRDWRVVIGGDGHDCAIDPKDPNIIYGESQQGYLRRYDRRTGEAVDIRPQPAEGEHDLRFNWDSPIEISFHDNRRLYFGARKLFRSNNRGDSWEAISPDLSRNQNRMKLPIMGRTWSVDATWDLFAMSEYNNITSIGESPVDQDLIYIGTDDGLIQVTEDGGKSWRKIDLIDGIPKMAFVNDIKADRFDANTVYVCLDNHKYGDYQPYVIRSQDRGKTWQAITNGIPDRHLTWRLIQDHVEPKLMFLGTEFGVHATVDGGENWFKFSNGLPVIPVRDLEIQRRENDLVAATFGRSFYVLDDYSPLRQISASSMKEKKFQLFPVKEARQYPQADFLGGQKGSQGDSFYAVSNPPYGAAFNYFCHDRHESLKAKRKAAEQKARDAGQDVGLPTAQQLELEEQEKAPQLVFTVRDQSQQLIRTLTTPVRPGLQRIHWDLRNRRSQYVAPGKYSIQVEKVTADQANLLAGPTIFEVVACIDPTIPYGDRREINRYYDQVYQLQQKVQGANDALAAAMQSLDDYESAIRRDGGLHRELKQQLESLKAEHRKISQQIANGSPFDEKLGNRAHPSLQTRLRNARRSLSSLAGPTGTHRDSYRMARKMYAELYPLIQKFVEKDVPAFGRQVEKAGLGWTPGQPVPEPSR